MSGRAFTAIVSGLAAVLAALLVAGATVLADEHTIDRELAHERLKQEFAARGAAAVYGEQLYYAQLTLNDAVDAHHWPRHALIRFFALPSLEDRHIVQSELPSHTGSRLEQADAAMTAMEIRIEESAGKPLTSDDLRQISDSSRRITRGGVVIAHIADMTEHDLIGSRANALPRP
jgi:hypothetical protein